MSYGKKSNLFGGMSFEEVCQLKLPDRLKANLDILVVGINPGMFSAYKGHHYAKPGNHFWKCLYLSGLTPTQLEPLDNEMLPVLGIGLTNIVERTTRSSSDLDKKEIQAGADLLVTKINKLSPKIVVLNGKQIYNIFSKKNKFNLGLQPELVEGTNSTHIWIMASSSSGRCTTLCRAEDKVPYYAALKKFRDYLNGYLSEIDEKEFVFAPLKAQKIKHKCKESLYFNSQLNDMYDKFSDIKKKGES